jgi:hypothetical protein
MASIFGIDGFFDSNKVQNQSATPGYTNFAGVLAENGQPVAVAVVGGYLPLSGGTMTGDIDMATHDLKGVGNIDNIAASQLVSCATSGVSGDLPIFNGVNRQVTDSGTLLSDLATNAALANYLPLAGGTMAGNVDMGTHNISDLFLMQFIASIQMGNGVGSPSGYDNTGIIIGGGASTNDSNTITIGNGAATQYGGGTGNLSIAIGNNSHTGNGGPLDVSESIAIGSASLITANMANNGNGSIAIGANSSVAAYRGIAIGHSATNTVDNTAIIGNSNLTDISSNSTTCDLGGIVPWQNISASVSVISPLITTAAVDAASILSIGPTTATSIVLGRTGQIVDATPGDFYANVPYGSWSCVVGYSPNFTANVARLVPPGVAVSGNLNLFTQLNGVLTYTGTRIRVYQFFYTVNLNRGAIGDNMTFFNSYNGGTTLTTGARATDDATATTTGTNTTLTFSDQVALSNGDTIQLAAACAQTSNAPTITFAYCNIMGSLS